MKFTNVCMYERLGIKVKPYQPNELNSRPNTDCTVRTICAIFGGSWDDQFKKLCKAAFETKTTINNTNCIKYYFEWWKNQDRVESIYIPGKKVRLVDILLSEEYQSGKYFIGIEAPAHALAFIDGVVYDSNYSLNKLDSILLSKVILLYKCK